MISDNEVNGRMSKQTLQKANGNMKLIFNGVAKFSCWVLIAVLAAYVSFSFFAALFTFSVSTFVGSLMYWAPVSIRTYLEQNMFYTLSFLLGLFLVGELFEQSYKKTLRRLLYIIFFIGLYFKYRCFTQWSLPVDVEGSIQLLLFILTLCFTLVVPVHVFKTWEDLEKND